MITERGLGAWAIMIYENDSEGLKDVNVITKFKQETHEKKATLVGSKLMLNTQ